MSTTENTYNRAVLVVPDLRILSRLRWLRVDSTNLIQYAYDASSEKLYVQLHRNPENFYAYCGFSPEAFVELSTAPSHGSYYSRNIARKYYTEVSKFELPEVEEATAAEETTAGEVA